MPKLERIKLQISGIVQGVGFRPFVYKLGRELGLNGFVCNTAAGVTIEVEGDKNSVEEFCRLLPLRAPELARIDKIERRSLPCLGTDGFVIISSKSGEAQTLISPDMGICDECLADIFDPANRRYRYAFTNCTNCGPRFTISKKLPYDRPNTSMAEFSLCAECAREYYDPDNRRFHAQPNACPVCGPRLTFCDNKGQIIAGDPLKTAQEALRNGQIIAVKGLGGYHLVCDALNNEAVAVLRGRKLRYGKAFALMLPDLAAVKPYCELNEAESALLADRRRPIVLLNKKSPCAIAEQVAPHNKRLGVMLPYTPLHYLLIEGFSALVMTSANLSDEPIAFEDADALRRLAPLTDGFLLHNRRIVRRCDDSVTQVALGRPALIRRSRGYAPEPLELPLACSEQIFAAGAEQKNTFCLTKGNQAFVSQHLGDLENSAAFDSYLRELEFFKQIFAITPTLAAYDLHPEYLASKYIIEQTALKAVGVQHHHAHLAAVLAEHKLQDQTIGVIFDGTGYGTDGKLWGGEFLVGDLRDFRRAAHLAYIPLPGGAKAIREPWRLALAYLAETFGFDEANKIAPDGLLPANADLLWQAVKKGINAPQACGMGRLFDGVSAILGVNRVSDYEGQAAVELEQAVTADDAAYDFAQCGEVIDWRPLIAALIKDIKNSVAVGVCAARFHNGVVKMTLEQVQKLAEATGLKTVCLSGGVWMNNYLLSKTVYELQSRGYAVYFNQKLPVNDGCIAYGQAAVAAARQNKETKL